MASEMTLDEVADVLSKVKQDAKERCLTPHQTAVAIIYNALSIPRYRLPAWQYTVACMTAEALGFLHDPPES